MTGVPKGFPDTFPVRAGDARSLRYRISAGLARATLRLVFGRRLHIVGVDLVPEDGPLIVVANHISNIDPMLMGGFFPRTLFAMAKREMYANPVAAWWLAGCNCLPVDRSAPDRRAVTRALDILHNGGRLLIFIEGTRSASATMQHAEPGAGFLVRRSGAAVQPVGIWGTEQVRGLRFPFLRRVHITVRFGAPFTLQLAGRRDDAVIADEIGARVAALLPPRYRGVHAPAVAGDGHTETGAN